MTTAYTSLLGLALPVTGELSGTWGDVVNNSITSLVDTSVAGTTNISTDANVTLTTTTGAANQARQAILLFSGARTAIRTVTAPAQSKIYTVINATTGGFSVKLVGVGPTTGVTIVAGESAVCAWNGSDFVKVSNTAGSGSFTNLTASGTVTFTGLSASQAVFTNALDELVSNAITGTGNVVMSASPTLTGTIGAAAATLSGNLTLSGGTANGVAYLNGSKVVTSGSALTFDGTNFWTTAGIEGTKATTAGNISLYNSVSSSLTHYQQLSSSYTASYIQSALSGASSSLVFAVNSNWTNSNASEGMRLTSTGLGIGTSSPASKLEVIGGAAIVGTDSLLLQRPVVPSFSGQGAPSLAWRFYSTGTTYTTGAYIQGLAEDAWTSTSAPTGIRFYTVPSGSTTLQQRLQIDNAGNLGLGVTPSAWGSGSSAFQNTAGGIWRFGTDNIYFGQNYYFNGTNRIYSITNNATEYQQGNGQHRWFNAPSGTAGNAITFTQAMTLDASGNLMVGTTTPSANSKLTLSGAGITIAGGRGSTYALNWADWSVYNSSSGNALVFDNGTERARIDSSGNLGVGITTPTQTVSVGVTTGTKGFNIVYPPSSAELACFTANASTGEVRIGATGGTYFPTFYSNGSERARIDTSGNLLLGTTSVISAGKYSSSFAGATENGIILQTTLASTGSSYIGFVNSSGSIIGSVTQSTSSTVAYNVTSDQRLKENIVDAPEFGSIIDSIQVRSFDWKTDHIHQRAGFIAQELLTVAPEAVHQPIKEDEMMAVDYSKLVPMLVKEIQSLRKRLADAGI